MKIIRILILACLAFSSCQTQQNKESSDTTSGKQAIVADSIADNSTPAQFSGIYEKGKFRTCQEPEKQFRVGGNKWALDLAVKQLFSDSTNTTGIYVELIGRTQGNDLMIDSVEAVAQKNAQNNCLPFKFWCTGTEPFWTLEISETENLIELYLPMEQRYIRYPYSEGKSEGNKTVYKLTDEKNSLNIVISKSPCSDGMSEKNYTHKVELLLNGQLMQGCAQAYVPTNNR